MIYDLNKILEEQIHIESMMKEVSLDHLIKNPSEIHNN
jgi:hypothetical protein